MYSSCRSLSLKKKCSSRSSNNNNNNNTKVTQAIHSNENTFYCYIGVGCCCFFYPVLGVPSSCYFLLTIKTNHNRSMLNVLYCRNDGLLQCIDCITFTDKSRRRILFFVKRLRI